MPYSSTRSIEGTVIAITGASSGIGAATAAALVDAGVRKWGRLDTMVANAGIGAYGGIMDLDDAELTEMVETNVLGTVWSVRSAVKQFRSQGDGGALVIVASVEI